MNDAYEPWYQVQSITYTEVCKMLETCMKYKIEDKELLNKIIKEVVPSKEDFGSYRGYATFLHAEYKKQILERFNYYNYKKPDK